MTSNSTSIPISFRFCCMYSFIGRGSICPEPLAEISILVWIGLSGPKPASARSARAASGSYLSSKLGLPYHGSAGETCPDAWMP